MYSMKCCKNKFLFYKIHCKSVTMVTTPTYFLPSTLKKELKGLQHVPYPLCSLIKSFCR